MMSVVSSNSYISDAIRKIKDYEYWTPKFGGSLYIIVFVEIWFEESRL